MTAPDARYLPAGFPLPDRETMARLRQSILYEMSTPHPPEWAELAVLITADEAGIDMHEVDPRAIWALSPEARAPIFTMLRRLLAEYSEG